MSAGELLAGVKLLWPELAAVALLAARLLPVVYLCPLLGGPVVPGFVKLGLVLSMAVTLRRLGAPTPAALVLTSHAAFGLAALREVSFGVVLGLWAALPLDAARMAGRFVDAARGSSAEAALPSVGTQEAASGQLLYQLVLAKVALGPLFGLLLAAVAVSIRVVKPGAFLPEDGWVRPLFALTVTAMGTGLLVAAPVVGAALALDALLGLVGRLSPRFPLQELHAPLKILGGAAILVLSLDVGGARLVGGVADALEALTRALEALHG